VKFSSYFVCVPQNWFDERLTWNVSEVRNVADIFVTSEHIWVPDIVLMNK